MTNDSNNAQGRDIPVPPGGGSWTWDEAAWKWVSNDPTPTSADLGDAAVHAIPYTAEQEQ